MGVTDEEVDGRGPTLAGSDSGSPMASGAPSADEPRRPRSETATGSTFDRQRAIELEEHAANVLRLRHALTLGVFLWSAFLAIDWVTVTYVEPAPFSRYLAYRITGALTIVAVVALLFRARPPGQRALLVLDCVVFGVATALVSLMCLEYRGLESPYAAGFPLLIGCRAAFVAQAWREGVWPNAVMVLTYPVVLFGSALFSDTMAAQTTDPAALGTFTLFFALTVSTASLAIFGGHTAWALRRQVFEARNVGRYRMVRQLGKGGMGEVWAAHHPGLKKDVALKILRPGARDDTVAVRRFEREVHATTELTHPNTVRIFDYGVTPDGLWYYAMELLEGVDLAALIEREGPLPPERAVHLLSQASRALAEAHERGIIHRDIKPENIFITTAGGEPDFVKVLDFGIAKITQGEPDLTLTSAGWIGGTPAYMSPEAAAGAEVGARSDVYALGATLYLALTGTPPFKDKTVGALLSAQQRTSPDPPSQRLGTPLPAPLEAVVMRCLAKSPDARYPDAAALADALAATRDDAPAGERPHRPGVVASERP